MTNIISAITNTVPVTQFNRGYAGKIFEEVKKSGTKAVMKNSAAECILLSPGEYVRIMDELNDMRLLTIVNRRMLNSDPAAWIGNEQKAWNF
ncbi:MAG: type II toxin-antitoxin system Phd/YefM family antitoxin [Erysipelotrichaceae bacterium]